ncbi:protein kinase domain-containing protein [Tissierellaceae bacterium HCP3S3_D8]
MLNITNEISDNVRLFCEKALERNFEATLSKHFIDMGSHGRVYNIPDTDYVIKFFTEKGIQGEYFDYIYLDILKGIDEIPIMYAYADKKFVVMEKIKGVNLFEYLTKHKKYPDNLKSIITDTMEQIFERKIWLVDLKPTEDIYWIEEENTIKIIDFGLCDNLSHMSNEFIDCCKQESIDSIFKELNIYGCI